MFFERVAFEMKGVVNVGVRPIFFMLAKRSTIQAWKISEAGMTPIGKVRHLYAPNGVMIVRMLHASLSKGIKG